MKITEHQEVYHEPLSIADVRPCASQCLAELTTVFVGFLKNLSNLASPCLPVYIGAGCDRPLIVFQILIGLIESKRPPNKIAYFPPSLMSILWNCQANVPGLMSTEAFAGDITYLDMSSLCKANVELHLHKQLLSQAWISTDYEFI
jgi:hypothetical protein